jgi:hypothetical protein
MLGSDPLNGKWPEQDPYVSPNFVGDGEEGSSATTSPDHTLTDLYLLLHF